MAYLLAKGRTAIPRHNRPRRSRILLLGNRRIRKIRGAVDDASKRLHDAGTGRARSVLRFRFNRCPARESECRLIGIDIGAMHRQTAAIVCRLPRVAAQQRPDPAVGIPKIHASPVDRRISCDADNALPRVSLLSVLPRFPNLSMANYKAGLNSVVWEVLQHLLNVGIIPR